MAVFMLETEALTSASSAISSLASQVNDVSSSINGYDTSCEDGFDFAGAKSVLASNVEACSTKITNTAVILENVVSAHTELQSSMKFDGSDNYSSSSSTSTNGSSSSSGSSSSGGDYSGGGTSGGGYSGGGYSGGGSYSGGSSSYSGGDYSGGYSGAAVSGTAVSGLVAGKVKDSNKDKVKERTGAASSKDEKETDKNKETNDSELTGILEEKVTTELKYVNYAYINSDKVTDKSKELFNDATFNYDSNTGYALVDGKYVIACDSTVGEVGDIIKFTQKDGNIVECVVGTNTVTDASKNVINFIVDKENWANKTPMSISENLINNTTTITNAGQYNVKPSGTITTLINENANTSKDISSSSTTDVKEV